MHVHCTICLCGEWEVGECRRNWWNFYNRHQSKMFSLKIFPCKETLRQMFFIVYRLEIQSVMLVFSTHLYELLPLSPSLWFNSPPYCNGRFWMPYFIPVKLLFLKLGSFRVFLCFHTYVSALRISCPQRIRMYNGVYKLNRCLNKD